MDDMFAIVLALVITAIAGVGAYVYWERKKTALAADGARRRLERKHLVEAKDTLLVAPPVVRQQAFGRR